MAAAQEAAPRLGAARTCRALGLAKASYYRRLHPVPGGRAARPSPPRSLSPASSPSTTTAAPP
jgi:hypothetical protein